MADITVPDTQPTGAAASIDSAVSQAITGEQPNHGAMARANLSLSLDAKPDYEASLAAAARSTGVPIDSARAFPDHVHQQAALNSVDWSDLAQNYPATAKFFGADINNARVAHDDVQNLAGAEHATFSIGRQQIVPADPAALSGPDASTLQYANRDAASVASDQTQPFDTGGMSLVPNNAPPSYRDRLRNFAYGLVGATPPERNEADFARASNQVAARNLGLTMGQARDAVGGMSEAPTQAAQGFYDSFLAGLAPDANGPAQTEAGSVARGAGQLAGFVAGVPLKLGAMAVDAAASRLLGDGVGQSFAKAIARDAGGQAATLGIASGLTAAGSALDQSTPGGAASVVAKQAASGAAMGALFGSAGRLLPDNTFLQNTMRVVAANAGMDLLNGTNPLDDRPTSQKIFDYGLNTLFGLHGAGRADGGWFQDAAKAQLAESDAGGLKAAMDASTLSKLRTRDPDAFKSLVTQANDSGPVQDVYVDANQFSQALAQSGVSVDDIQKTMPDVARQMSDALTTGGDISIRVPDLLTHVAGTPVGDAIFPHLKTDPDGFTQLEAQAFHQSHADEFRQAAEDMVSARDTSAATGASADGVYQDVLGQLNKTGRQPAEVGKVYATIAREFYGNTAARLGVDPAELYKQHPLNIVAENPFEGGLDQPNRGAYDPNTGTLAMLKDADSSTFVHEFGHHMLEVMNKVAGRPDAPEQVKGDFQTMLDHFGVKDADSWNKLDLEGKREHHETFARSFEGYLFEGKAPSEALRGPFSRLRAWMVNIYQTLRNLNVKMSDDVRGVFDRLLASNDAIDQAQRARAYAPLFRTAEEAGMTPEKFAEYHATNADATITASEELSKRTLGDLKYIDNVHARALSAEKRDVAEKRAAVRNEVAAQIAEQPIYQAYNFLSKGELLEGGRTNRERRILDSVNGGSTKLSISDMKQMYGEGEAAPWRYLSVGKNGLAGTEGIHPDLAAELFGYSSGDHLVRELLSAPRERDAVKAATDEAMMQRYGDITSPEALHAAANEAIQNKVRQKVIATELKALSKSVGSTRDLQRAARDAAEEAITRTKYRDLRPAKFDAAEKRSGKEAEEAFRKGDLEGAAAAKRNQLLNSALSRAASDARDDIDKTVRYLSKFDSDNLRKSIDPEYIDQIQAMLGRFDLRTGTTLKEIGRRQSLAQFIEKMTDQGTPPEISDVLMNEAYSTSYKEMTVGELGDLRDAVKNIEHLGRLKNRLLVLRDKRDFQSFIDAAAPAIVDNAKKTLPSKLESNQLSDKILARGRRFLADHRTISSLFQQMDGKDGGFLWDSIVRPMNERGDFEASRRAKATGELKEIFDGIDKGKLRQKMFIPEIKDSLSHEGRLSVALNWGNETNRARVMSGDKWSEGQVNAILKTLDKNDWEFVQKTWNHIDSYWPEIADKQRRVTGITPEKVQASPFTNPLGDQMSGGYYPIKYDPLHSSRAESNEEAATIQLMKAGAFTRATTRRGFTQARVDEVQGRPLRKDLGVITQHVEEVTHDLAWHEWLIDTNKVLTDDKFDAAVRAHYGPEVLGTIKDGVKAIALGDVGSRHAMDAMLAFLRKGTIVSRLGWNVTSAIKQFAGYGPTAALIGGGYMRQGMAEYMGSAIKREGITKSVYEKSSFMALRGQTLNRDIREIRNDIDAGHHPIIEAISKALPAAQRAAPVVDGVASSYLWLIENMQKHVDVPSWLGAYRKGLNDFAGDEGKSVAFADQIVRDSQGSGLLADQPNIMRGGQLAKLFTTFYSALNAQYNVMAKAKGQGGVTKLAYAMTVGIIMPSLFTAALGELRGHEQDNDEWWQRLLKDWGQETLGSTAGMMVGVRELTSILQGFDYTGPTPLTPLSDAGKLFKQAGQGDFDEGLGRAANTVAGDVLHYPASMLDKVYQGYTAWQNGDSDARALVLGKPSK